MAYGRITSWQIDGIKVETVTNFLLLGPKITADGDYSQKIRKYLLLGRKAMTNLDNILKSKDIILPTKVHIVKGMVFPIVMYWCDTWIINEPECQKIDAFELWCWRRLLKVPWTARSNQSILKEIKLEYSLEGLMLKLKCQYFGHLIVFSWFTGKDPDTGKDWGYTEKGVTKHYGWMTSLSQWTWVWANFER